MSKHEKLTVKASNPSFKRAALLLEPSMIAIACHLARIAAENDYKSFLEESETPYNGAERKGGPQ